jgi:outer membrane lipoprotein-sorting protein
MRRQPSRSARVSASALFAIVALALCAAAPRDLFDDIYARSHALESSIHTVTARFTETSTSSLLTTPVLSRGTLAVERPDRIVMRYSDPDGRILLIDGDELTLVWPSKGVHERSNIGPSRRRIDKYFVDKSPDELRKSFSIAARLAPDRSNAWEVTMTPTRSQIRQGLTRLTLWIDRSSLLLTKMGMEFPSGDNKTLAFEDVVVNGPVDRRMFTLTP